jgi:hypothetical protein
MRTEKETKQNNKNKSRSTRTTAIILASLTLLLPMVTMAAGEASNADEDGVEDGATDKRSEDTTDSDSTGAGESDEAGTVGESSGETENERWKYESDTNSVSDESDSDGDGLSDECEESVSADISFRDWLVESQLIDDVSEGVEGASEGGEGSEEAGGNGGESDGGVQPEVTEEKVDSDTSTTNKSSFNDAFIPFSKSPSGDDLIPYASGEESLEEPNLSLVVLLIDESSVGGIVRID